MYSKSLPVLAATVVAAAGVSAHLASSQFNSLTSRAVDASTLQGKWLFGYQAWFRNEGAGVNTHWSPAGIPSPDTAEIDCWPDVTGYPADCLIDTGYTLPNGQPAQVYDNTCEGVVDLHFQMLQEYNLDGMLVQRGWPALNDASFLTILDQVQAAAEKYGRVFAIEYDLSGANSSEESVTNAIYIDFENNVEKYTNSSAYVKQDGKPYVQIYGPGTPDRGVSADDAYDLVRDLKSEKNLFIGISPDMDWGSDVRNNTGFVNVYKESDLIVPWSVGTFKYAETAYYMQGHVTSDAALAASIGVPYAYTIWPGSSSFHIQDRDFSDYDAYPRYNGSFYKDQVNELLNLNPSSYFVMQAMWDEHNEATQVLPALKVNQLPTEDYFVGYDNDFANTSFYLGLASQATAAYKASLSLA